MKPPTKILAAIILAAASPAVYGQAAKTACPVPPGTEARPWLNARYSPQCRAQFVLNSFKTLDEKFAFLSSGGGGRGAATPAIDLGLTRGGGVDGPAGVARGAG